MRKSNPDIEVRASPSEYPMLIAASRDFADKLSQKFGKQFCVINKRYDAERGVVDLVRSPGEDATGEDVTAISVPVGFVVVLQRDVTTPLGRSENLFLARALWDGTRTTFRCLLRGWMTMLGLHDEDLLGGMYGFEVIDMDAAVFDDDHLILDATSTEPTSC
jgi:hypothetical protein